MRSVLVGSGWMECVVNHGGIPRIADIQWIGSPIILSVLHRVPILRVLGEIVSAIAIIDMCIVLLSIVICSGGAVPNPSAPLSVLGLPLLSLFQLRPFLDPFPLFLPQHPILIFPLRLLHILKAVVYIVAATPLLSNHRRSTPGLGVIVSVLPTLCSVSIVTRWLSVTAIVIILAIPCLATLLRVIPVVAVVVVLRGLVLVSRRSTLRLVAGTEYKNTIVH